MDGQPLEPAISSARVIDPIRLFSGTPEALLEAAEPLQGLVTHLLDPRLPGTSWRADSDGNRVPADVAEIVADLPGALGTDGRSLLVATMDSQRLASAVGVEHAPELQGVEASWTVQRTTTGSELSFLVVRVELALDADPMADDSVPTDRFDELATIVEERLYGMLTSQVRDLLVDHNLIPDEYSRTVLDRHISSPKFYVYELSTPALVEPEHEVVHLLAERHLNRAGPRSETVQASIFGRDTTVLRHLFQNPLSLLPLYLIVTPAGNGSAASSITELLASVEAASAYQLWDASTDVRMHEDHLHEHRGATADGRRVINQLTAEPTGDSEVRVAQRVFTLLDQAAVELAEDAQQTRQRLASFEKSQRSAITALFDEQAVAGTAKVTDSLLDSGTPNMVRSELEDVTDNWDRIQRSYEYLHESAGRVAEDVRDRELALLEKSSSAMNVLLGLLAVVLATDALFELRFDDPPDFAVSLLRILTLVVAALALIGIAVGLTRRFRRTAPDPAPALTELLEFTAEVTQVVDGPPDPSQDLPMAQRLCDFWEQWTTGQEKATRIQRLLAMRLLRAPRPPNLYRGPYPWLACTYMAAQRISPFEFDRTVAEWGFLPLIQAPRLRDSIVEASLGGRSPTAILEALVHANPGSSGPEDVIARFRAELSLGPERPDAMSALADLAASLEEEADPEALAATLADLVSLPDQNTSGDPEVPPFT